MRRIARVAAALVVGTILWAPARPAAQGGAAVALRAAMETETVKGDLKAAIEQYRVLTKNADRAIAAQALVRMAGCHQKLGDAQAKAIFEQVVRDYADQKDAVAVARAFLRGSNGGRSVRGDRAVWTGPDVDPFGRVSPDGTFITYVDWAGAGHLMLHDLATGTNRPLTAHDAKPYSQWAEYSVIAPDSRKVAYTWGFNPEQRREIRRITVGGPGVPTPAVVYAAGDDVRFIGPLDWSPDGKWLAASVARKDGTGQIALIGAADGSFRVLKTVRWKGPERAFFSRDSRFLAYDLPATDTSNDRDLFVMALDSAREAPAVVHSADDRLVGWSPDGRLLLFSSDRTGSRGLWAQPVSDGTPRGAPELLKSDIGRTLSLGLTDAGTLYVYKTISGRDVRVARVDLAAGALLEAPRSLAQGFVTNATVPDWSPDGTQLAYQACDERDCVAIRSVQTGQVRTLQGGLHFTRAPRWSPDGRTFITAARDRRGKDGIFRIDAQTGEVTNVVYGPLFFASPLWSKDGAKIFYQHEGLRERDLSTGAERELLPPPFERGQIAVSPDGQWLALAGVNVNPTANRRLRIVPTGAGDPRDLLALADGETWGPAGTLAWAPDSRAVLTLKGTAEGKSLWLVPIDGGSPRKLDIDAAVFTGGGGGLDSGFSLSPDGRQMAFLTGKKSVEVWALENFLPPSTAAKR